MLQSALVLIASLATVQEPRPKAGALGAADRVVLRDGSEVLGRVLSATTGPRGAVEMLVRRAWAERRQPGRARRWSKAVEAGARLAIRQRRGRLAAWRRERAPGAPADDRILAWIDRELKRLDDPKQATSSVLLPVHLSRSDVRSLYRAPGDGGRLLALGWLCGLPDVEAMPLDDLKGALEARGYALDGDQAPSIAGLLPLAPEPDPAWLARRAATEVAVDPDLRLLRYHGMVLPEPRGGGQPFEGLDLGAALSELKRLLDPGAAGADPLAERLKAIAARGRVGAKVTRMEISADLAQVTIETTLWVRTGGDRWVPFVSRSAAVRPDDLPPEAGKGMEADPQVQAASSLVEALGLGPIPAESKQRALRMGAATEKALGLARSALNEDLGSLALPVFDPPLDAPATPPRSDPGRGPGTTPPGTSPPGP